LLPEVPIAGRGWGGEYSNQRDRLPNASIRNLEEKKRDNDWKRTNKTRLSLGKSLWGEGGIGKKETSGNVNQDWNPGESATLTSLRKKKPGVLIMLVSTRRALENVCVVVDFDRKAEGPETVNSAAKNGQKRLSFSEEP